MHVYMQSRLDWQTRQVATTASLAEEYTQEQSVIALSVVFFGVFVALGVEVVRYLERNYGGRA